MINTDNKKEKYILVSCSDSNEIKINKDLDELEELVKTAGGETLIRVIQRLDKPNPRTYIGTGKIEEVKNLITIYDADAVVCDDELTPSQMANLSKELDIKVIDRTIIILDIFSKRAKTKEGKLQVELAQLSNFYTHMKGNVNLSRLGGGIGTRGPGEKKLELDRRYIRNNINNLRHELKELRVHNELIKSSREKKGIFRFSIVGYTNAGKSTLLNKLTNAGVLQEDKLFATLDLTTRKFILNSGKEVLLTDTVGFINKLPHNLVESFRGTLEDAKYSDALIHVVDISDENYILKMHLVYELLNQLEIKDKPILTIFNKTDLADYQVYGKDPKADISLHCSLTKDNTEKIVEAMDKLVNKGLVRIQINIGYKDYNIVERIRKYGKLIEEKFLDEKVYIDAYVNEELFNILHRYRFNVKL